MLCGVLVLYKSLRWNVCGIILYYASVDGNVVGTGVDVDPLWPPTLTGKWGDAVGLSPGG